MKIILSERGLKRRTVEVNKIRIHDIWHIAMRIEDKDDQCRVLEVWHLAHDMLAALQSFGEGADISKPIHTK